MPDKKTLKQLHRRSSGMTLGLVAVCALLIILVLGAGFEFMVYMGGSQELKNSVDAAALNVSTRAVENKVLSNFVAGYDDVADSTQMFGLTNINRLWGKAFLINANAQEMNQTGYMSGTAFQNSEMAYTNVDKINARLFTLLNSKDAADVHFNQIANDKPAKLMGAGGAVRNSAEGSWATACLYRGEESNILLNDPSTLPPGTTANLITHNNSTYLQGYNSMQANNRHFCLTTFHADEAPHLVAASTFEQGYKSAVANATNPIPNAFREGGELNGKVALSASACAVANPMRSYQLTIPHAYVTISFQSQAVWIVQGSRYATTNYSFDTGKVWQVKSYKLQKPGKGFLNGYAMLGQEYQPPTLWQVINALPGDHAPVLNKLLQRLKEFMPGYTMAQLTGLLQSQQLASGESAFYIYPVYNSVDNTDPQVKVSPAGVGNPRWLQPTQADGNEKLLLEEETVSNYPNFCWSVIAGPYPKDKHFTSETGEIFWRPGTGWQQNLGDVRIQRTTTIVFTGLP